MEKDLSNYRKSYEKGALLLSDVPDNPMLLFKTWFDEVDGFFENQETNAMTISTIGLDGFPKSRVVLLKKVNEEGFVFFTNYHSEKGLAMANNPNVCLSFFWHGAERQIIIKGSAEKIDEKSSNDYFESRPRGSQLGALVSNQSEVITHRQYLEDKLAKLEDEYQGKLIERPEHWGGYIVKPLEIEFWQGRKNRLHDRVRYMIENNKDWTKSRLSP
ncbi:pyridoxamine 5'-phosphate oxidase [uncultured Algibacter sp.]|uniref:pyridoxamine 5'-phosphate oxidase n=1 Tax=uncultured Algibacter sp. TaxID=298659 RepID=UPI003217B6F2